MRIATLALVALLPLPAGAADSLPSFRPGLWEFRRSVDGGDGKPAELTTQKCTDPTADMQKKMESLITAGCKPTPVTKNGSRYSFSLKCELQGIDVETKSLITFESESAYLVDAESKQDGNTTREQLSARRIGNCPEAGT
jgi:hypothetical protein